MTGQSCRWNNIAVHIMHSEAEINQKCIFFKVFQHFYDLFYQKGRKSIVLPICVLCVIRVNKMALFGAVFVLFQVFFGRFC